MYSDQVLWLISRSLILISIFSSRKKKKQQKKIILYTIWFIAIFSIQRVGYNDRILISIIRKEVNQITDNINYFIYSCLLFIYNVNKLNIIRWAKIIF
jgi:hypothetical protein